MAETVQLPEPDGEHLAGLFNSSRYEPGGVGLALSGGGYKAAAYHLGALIRLNELGWLPRLSRVASVSGSASAIPIPVHEWIVIPPMATAAMPVEAVTDRRGSPANWSRSAAAITLLPVPARPVMSVF